MPPGGKILRGGQPKRNQNSMVPLQALGVCSASPGWRQVGCIPYVGSA